MSQGPRFRRFNCVALVPLLLLATGCTYRYEITIKPAGTLADGQASGGVPFQRTLTVWKYRNAPSEIQGFPQADLDRIAGAYGGATPTKLDQKHTFSGQFTGKMPADVPSSGTLSRWVSPFGTTTLYMERFGGNDDFVGQFQGRKIAADRLTDLLIGWLETEVGREPGWPKLRQFLDTQARRDIENLSALVLVASGEGTSFDNGSPEPRKTNADSEEVILTRVLQYLTERGYVEVNDLPALLASLEDDGRGAVRWGARFLENKLGLPDGAPRPPGLGFLADPKIASQSLDRYLRLTPEYQKLEVAWSEKRKESPDQPPPESLDVLIALFGDAFFQFHIFEDSTELSITLHCPVAPVSTNGAWDETRRVISWNTPQNGDQGLPTFVFAYWAEPNTEAQVARFGKEVLVGESLRSYVLWYAGLDKEHAAEWDAFLAGLEPGPDLATRIEAFRFKSDPAPDPEDAVSVAQGQSRAQGGIHPIVEALNKSQSK